MNHCKRLFSLLLVLCMVIPMCLITVSAETTIEYTFYYDNGLTWESKGLAKIMDDTSPNQAVLEAAYNAGTINFLPVAHAGYSVPYLHSVDHYPSGTSVADTSNYNGIKINSKKIGDWFAFKIKNPGDGYFNVSVNVLNSVNGAMGADVYILSGVEADAASIESELTAANLYGNVDFKRKDVQPYGNVLPEALDATLESKTSDGDYIIVFKVTKNKAGKTEDTASDNQTYIWMTGLTLTKTTPGSTTPTVKPTTPTTATTPSTPANPGVTDGAYRLFHSSLTDLGYSANGDIALSKQQEVLNSLYASGAMDVIPIGDKTENVTYLNYGAASSGKFEFNGIKLQKAKVGDYVALKFRSPGTGGYSISLDTYYLNANNAARLAAYILPGSTAVASIDGMLTDENRVSYVDISTNNTAKTETTVPVVSNADLEAGKDYILVLQFNKDNYQPDADRVDMMLTGLSFGEGFIVEPAPFDPVSGDTVLENAVKAASAYRGITGVNPLNGHDLMYLLFKGSMMIVVDMDDKTIYDIQYISHSTPFGMCFDPDGNLWLCGTGTFISKYDPATKTGVKYTFAKSDFFGGSTNGYGITYVDGYLYFGYNGCFGRVDAATGEIERISEQICVNEAKSDSKWLGYPGMIYRDGYLYTSTHGDNNGDQIYTSAIIKYEIATGKIVDSVDVAYSTRDYGNEAGYGVSGLYMVNDMLVGTYSNRKPQVYIDISGDKMELVDKFYNFDTHFIQSMTAPIDGKVYVAGYVDNEATSKCLYQIDLQTQTVTRMGDIVYLTTVSAENGIATVEWDEGLPGTSIVTYLNNSATGTVDLIFYNPTTMETVIWDGVVTPEYGTGMTLRALTSDDTGRYIYVGAYGTNQITRYDTVEKTFETFPGTDHQTDSLTYYKDKLYIGNYHTGTITQLDPETGDVTPYFNLYDSVFQQERMFGITAGDNKVFCGTIPDASRTGGTLVWFDLEENRYYVAGGPNPEDCYYADYASFVVWYNCATGQVETFDRDGDGVYDYDILVDDKGDDDPTNNVYEQVIKGLIPTQCPNDLVYKDGLIYGCTTKHNGDAVATKFDGNAQLFVYDVDAKKLLATCDPGQFVEGLEDPKVGYIDYIDAIAADPYEDGKFWCVINDTLLSYSFDTETNTFTNVKEEFSTAKGLGYRHATSTWHSRTILFDGDYMYVGFHNKGIWMVNTADPSKAYQISVYTPSGGMARGQDGNIYYISNQDSSKPVTSLCVFNIAEGAQPAVAQSVQALIDALPENMTMEQEAQLLTVYKMYRDLREPAKALVDATKLNNAISALADQLAAKADSLIDAIGEVTTLSGPAIRAARSYYDDLPDAVKAKVTKLSVLEAAEAKFAALRKANPSGKQDGTTDPAPKNNTLIIVIIAVAAVVVIGAAVVAVILIRKKKAKEE